MNPPRLKAILSWVAEAVLLGLALAFVLEHSLLSPNTPASLPNAAPSSPTTNNSLADAVERATPSVVNIYTSTFVRQRINPLIDNPTLRRFFGLENQPEPTARVQNSLGSGVIVDATGYVITNYHVIEGADEILVAMQDGQTSAARLLGVDPDTDLAILRIKAHDLHAIKLANSDQARVGDTVLAIGNPFGVGQTVTSGIVSATGRNRLGINTYENFIQTDAAINPGNSGGALINKDGNLLGINTAIFSKSGGSQGIGFSIPANTVREVFNGIIQHGHVPRGWLGIQTQDLDMNLARSFGLSSRHGALITRILRNGPADQAGLRPGDLILATDDKLLRDAHELMNRIAAHHPGSNMSFEVVRQGQQHHYQAELGERPNRQKR